MDEKPCGILSQIEEAAIQAHIRLEESGDGLSFLNIFKAGAEWMAGQGEVFDGFMSVKGKRSLIAIKGSSQNFKYGDNVIVQIRKK